MGGRWSRVRNETILSSRGREGRCEKVGVVFSPLRRLTSLRRDEGGSVPGAEVGRALPRWGPSAASCLEIVGGRGSVKLTKMTHLLSVRFPLASLAYPFTSLFSLILATDATATETLSSSNFKATLALEGGADRNKSQYAVKRIGVCVIRKVLRYCRWKKAIEIAIKFN